MIAEARSEEFPDPEFPSTRSGSTVAPGAAPTMPVPSAAAAAIVAVAVPWPAPSAVSEIEGWPASKTQFLPSVTLGSSAEDEKPESASAIN